MKFFKIIILFVISLVLLLVIIYYDYLVKITRKLCNKNNQVMIYLIKLYDIIDRLFRTLRKFSISYLLKSHLKTYYIIIPLFIVVCKLLMDHASSAEYEFPEWVIKSIDFFVITAGWELLCFGTKIIDDLTKK